MNASFTKLIQETDSLLIEELWNAPKALLALQALSATKKNILLITQDPRLFDDFGYFSTQTILDFPSWETLPTEEIAPSPDIVGKRFEILYALAKTKGPHIVTASLQAVLQKTVSKHVLASKCLIWKVGDEVSFSALPNRLIELGYRRNAVAADKGEFAVRGGIIDIFPLASPDPYRIDFFGDTIDQIRTYDPIGQKSIAKASSLFLCPAKETNVDASLLSFLSPETLVIFDDLAALEDHYVSLKMPMEEFFAAIDPLQKIYFSKEKVELLSDVSMHKKTGRAFYSGKTPLQPLSFNIFNKEIHTQRWQHPFIEIVDFFSPYENKAAGTADEILLGLSRFAKSTLTLRIISPTESEERSLKEKISTLPSKTAFERGYLSSGFVLPEEELALLPTAELTHRYRTRRPKWRNTYHTPASEFHELSPGDIVVHFHHGIGKYLGVEKQVNHLKQEAEFLKVEFAEKSTLFVPVSQSHLVSRYIGSRDEIPTLHTLGGSRWNKTKASAEKAIIGYAKDLLRFSAEREIQGGFAYLPDGSLMDHFEQEFPFVETEDQLRAIGEIKRDMISGKAMDRLICGDVGYGKTEVAMRAAFKAVCDGKKQVAVLVPTTVLALQHYESFCERMAGFPITIGRVSRFQTPKENKETLEKVAAGQIDILIGTHRIISKDVAFKDLGLLIIDEEQRFGVRAKEHLKALKIGVDCLTLSATPIPRTLYLSLVGAKEISVINTPPQDRLPIKSILAPREPALIHTALLRELSRDGQAFFIHNRVETIYQIGEELQKLLPEARIVIGHGQMAADELDTIFHSFKTGQADILVATTIVENGIDIPNANTILIDRADQFGLADLYQLRGRVGRWNRPAFAYFLTPRHKELPELTRKRLSALIESSGYGGGMKIAMRDLEIRGAGDILGTQQSGQIATIGFHLYCKLLKRTIDALQRKIAPNFIETKMEFAFEARLPETYIGETSLRLEIYHRFGDATSLAEVDALFAELSDRFGPPPASVDFLYHLTRLRLYASQHQFTLLKFSALTLLAEKPPLKKSFTLPRFKTPKELEERVIELLKSFI